MTPTPRNQRNRGERFPLLSFFDQRLKTNWGCTFWSFAYPKPRSQDREGQISLILRSEKLGYHRWDKNNVFLKIKVSHFQDASYYERRKKNNDAAKRSRDARKMKEEQTAARASFLESENIQLRTQIELMKGEIAKLQVMLLTKSSSNDYSMSMVKEEEADSHQIS